MQLTWKRVGTNIVLLIVGCVVGYTSGYQHGAQVTHDSLVRYMRSCTAATGLGFVTVDADGIVRCKQA